MRLACLFIFFVISSFSFASAGDSVRFVPQVGHGQEISALALSKDGKVLISGGKDDLVKAWDVASGKEFRTLSGHLGGIRALAISEHGNLALSGDNDGVIRLWNIEQGVTLRTFAGHDKPIMDIAASPDFSRFASVSQDGKLIFWKTSSEQLRKVVSASQGAAISVAVTDDWTTCLVGTADGRIQKWDVFSGLNFWTLKLAEDAVVVKLSSSLKDAVAVTSTGISLIELSKGTATKKITTDEELASISAERISLVGQGTLAYGSTGGRIKRWDLKSGASMDAKIGHGNKITALVASPVANDFYVSGDDGSIRAVDVDKREQRLNFVNDGAALRNVKLSRDGKTLVTSTKSGEIQIWDTRTRTKIKSLIGHESNVLTFEVSDDGTKVVSVGRDKTMRFWDVETGSAAASFSFSQPWSSMRFSGNGKAVVASFDDPNIVRIWRWNESVTEQASRIFDGQVYITHVARTAGYIYASLEGSSLKLDSSTLMPVKNLNVGGFEGLYVSKDERYFLTQRHGFISLFDVEKNEHVKQIPTLEFGAGMNGIVDISLSPDNRYAMLVTFGQMVRVYDFETYEEVGTFHGTDSTAYGGQAMFSSDSKRLYVISEGTIAEVEIFASPKLKIFQPRGTYAPLMAFNPAQPQLIIGDRNGQIRIRDLKSGKEVRRTLAHQGALTGLVIDKAGNTVVASSTDGSISAWDLKDWSIKKHFKADASTIDALAVSDDGSMMLSAGDNKKTPNLWTREGQLVRSFGEPESAIAALAISHDNKLVASTTYTDNAISVWNVETGRKMFTTLAHSATVTRIQFSPDNSTIMSASHDRAIAIWSAKSGELIRLLRAETRERLSDGVSAIGDNELSKTIQYHEDGSQTISTYTGALVQYAAFLPDGASIVSVHGDRTIRLWDVKSGKEDVIEWEDGDYFRGAALAPDGAHLALMTRDRINYIYDLKQRKTQVAMMAFPGDSWVSWTKDGFFDFAGRGAEELTVARGASVYSIAQIKQELYRPDLVAQSLAGDLDGLVSQAAAKLDLTKILSSGSPPSLQSAGQPAKADEKTITLSAVAFDAGGGIGRVEWRVNGVTRGVTARGLARVDAVSLAAGEHAKAPEAEQSKKLQLSERISLQPGSNVIEVTVFNASNLISSNALTFTLDYTPKVTPPKRAPRMFVLSAGVNDYWDSRLRLNFASTDATSIAEAFRTASTGMFDDVVVRTLLDTDVTRASLDTVFTQLGEEVGEDDVFIFYLAGHGKTVDGRYYFIPADFRFQDQKAVERNGISQDDFQKWFSGIAANKSVLLYDTCESGSLIGGNERNARGLAPAEALQRLTWATGRTTLTASTDSTPALEGYRGHGIFTYALLDGLTHGDNNGDGWISVTELAGAIDREVPRISFDTFRFRQVPQMSIIGSSFDIARKVDTSIVEAKGKAPTDKKALAPTHVVISSTATYRAEDGSSSSIAAGTLVRATPAQQGRLEIEKNGKPLGTIDPAMLTPIQ